MGQLSYSDATNVKNQMYNNRSRYYNKWKDAADFLSPNRFQTNTSDKHNGSKKDQKIYKDTARLALRTFVSGMMNGATPQSRPWFRLATADPSLANLKQAKNFFSQTEKIMDAHFQLSNLYRVLPQAYKDVGAFSNAAYAMLPHAKLGFYFYPFAIGSFGFSSNHEGRTDTFFREFNLSIKQIVQKFGKLKSTGQIDWENSLNDHIRSQWEAARYEDTLTLTNLILPNPNPKQNALFSYDKAYQSYTWVDTAGGSNGLPNQSPNGFAQSMIGGNARASVAGGVFLDVKGYGYFPIITPRWEVAPEEDYGTDGPGELALATTKGLQSKEKYRQEAIAKMVKPPMIGPAALRRHQSSILAGGITYIDEAHKGQFRPAMTIDPKISELVQSQMEDVQDIKACFYEDLFMMLSSERKVSHVTKTEIQERASEKLQGLAPVLGQLDQDQNGRLIENAFIILSEQGKIPQVPRELAGKHIKPEYISVLAQASKAASMTSIEKVIGFAGSYSQAVQDPSLLQMFNHEEILKRYAIDYVGIDPELVRDDAEFAQIKQQIAQQQAQAQQMQMQQQQAATAKDMSQAKLGENSVLDSIMGQEQ